MLQAIEGRIVQGLAGLDAPKVESLTVAELAKNFLGEYSRPRVKDIGDYRNNPRTALRRVLPQLGDRPADQVKPADVAKLRDVLSRRYAAGSVKVSLAFLYTLFSWAVREELAPQNPCRGVERPRQRAMLEFLSMCASKEGQQFAAPELLG